MIGSPFFARILGWFLSDAITTARGDYHGLLVAMDAPSSLSSLPFIFVTRQGKIHLCVLASFTLWVDRRLTQYAVVRFGRGTTL